MRYHMRWDPEYSVGYDEIDRQHQDLIALTNKLFMDMAQGMGMISLEYVMARLESFVRDHFDSEEKLMLMYDYPEKETHRERHQEFMDRFYTYREELAAGNYRFALDLYQFLRNWLHEHFLEEDQKLGSFLKSHATGEQDSGDKYDYDH